MLDQHSRVPRIVETALHDWRQSPAARLLHNEAVDLLYEAGHVGPTYVEVYPHCGGYIVLVPGRNLSAYISLDELRRKDRETMTRTCARIHVPCMPYNEPDPEHIRSRGARRRRSWKVWVASAITSGQQLKGKLGPKRKA